MGGADIEKTGSMLSSCPTCLREEILKEFGTVDGIVLDVGYGHGDPTKVLSKKCSYIVGLDIRNVFDRFYISPTFDFCLGDAVRLPFRDESFDAVTSFDVIEPVEDDLKFLREIRRVMKKGAKLLLETPNRERLSNRIRGLDKLAKYPRSLGPQCIHIREYSKEELRNLMENAGFRGIKLRESGLD